MLRGYLKQIQIEEDLHGQQDWETERRILIERFNGYTFENEEELIKFFVAHDILHLPLLGPHPIIENCGKALGEKYNLEITFTGLTMWVNPRSKEWSYREGEGWHEGYDPFFGDINRCFGETLEEAIKGLFVKDTQHKWPSRRTDKIGLITEGCGYGKTHWIEHELIDEINDVLFIWNGLRTDTQPLKKKDILFITTRRSILDQQLRKGEVESAVEEDFTTLGANPIYDDREDKVRIITTSRLGAYYREGKIQKMPPVVVIDELHSLFLDTMFAEESYFCIECITHFWKDTIKIGLTATPDLLLGYINQKRNMFYLLDDSDLVPKYNAEEVIYCNYTYLKSSLKLVEPREDNKVIVYCASAKSAVHMAAQQANGAYLISNYNRDKEAVEKQQELYHYVIKNEKLPEDVYILFMTSAYREGVEIKDPAVKNVIIDASDEITISQFIGRIRADLRKVIINTNKLQYDRIMAIDEEYKKLKELPEVELAEYYGKQLAKIEKQENITLFVMKIDGNYVLNQYIVPVQSYLLDCYIQANNRGNSQIIKNGGRDLVSSKDWFEAYLGKYSRKPIRGAVGSAEVAVEAANWQAVEEYLDRRLSAADKAELAQKIGLKDPKTNRTVKWNTLKKELVKRQYEISDCKSGSSRFSIIKIGTKM